VDGETVVGLDISHFALGEGQGISFDMVFIRSCEEQIGVFVGNTQAPSPSINGGRYCLECVGDLALLGSVWCVAEPRRSPVVQRPSLQDKVITKKRYIDKVVLIDVVCKLLVLGAVGDKCLQLSAVCIEGGDHVSICGDVRFTVHPCHDDIALVIHLCEEDPCVVESLRICAVYFQLDKVFVDEAFLYIKSSHVERCWSNL